MADFRTVKIRAGSAVRIDELIEDSFVTLGGPKANGITEQVLQRLGGRVPVQYDQVSGAFRFKGDEFAPLYDEREFVARDYALILRLLHLDDDNSKSKAVLVVFGLHGHGTEQAVRAISDHDPLYQKISPYFGNDCWAFLRFDFRNHSCTDRIVIDSGKLN